MRYEDRSEDRREDRPESGRWMSNGQRYLDWRTRIEGAARDACIPPGDEPEPVRRAGGLRRMVLISSIVVIVQMWLGFAALWLSTIALPPLWAALLIFGLFPLAGINAVVTHLAWELNRRFPGGGN